MTAIRNRMGFMSGVCVAATLCMCIALACLVPSAVAQMKGTASQDNSVDGESVFAQCSPCHSLSPSHNDRGPTLYHLFGRKAGSVVGYHYSPAMKSAAIVWRQDVLASFLADPRRVVPGTTMEFAGLADSARVKALMDYLLIATQ